MVKKAAHLGQHIRFAAHKNIINMSREHSDRATFVAKYREETGVKGGALTAQVYTLQQRLTAKQIFFCERWKATGASLNPYAGAFNRQTRPWRDGPHSSGTRKKTSRPDPSACRNAFLMSKLQILHFLLTIKEIT